VDLYSVYVCYTHTLVAGPTGPAPERVRIMTTINHSVCIIGLGAVGLPTATYFQSLGCNVIGYDISRRAMVRARDHIPVGDINEISSDTEVFVICVSTTLLGDEPDVSNVKDACTRISQKFHPKLVSIESTVPIGTCRKIYDSIFDGQVNLVHIPHRYWPEDPVRHGVAQLRVAGAMSRESMIKARKLYSDLGIPLVEVEPIEIAEMTKIAENAYRYVQISFAEELRLICQRNNVDFSKLRIACNSKWNIEIPEARSGIGGTCLPKDIRYLINAAKNRGFEPDLLLSAIRTDKKYVEEIMKPLIFA